MNYTERTTCRVCATALPKDNLLSLGDQAIVDFLAPEEQGRGKAPLDLVLCSNCQLVQLRHTVNADTLYRTFWYRSGINEQMRAALLDVVDSAIIRIPINDSDVVGDIGSNDGTLLTFWDQSPEWVFRVGFEPATKLAEESRAKLEDGVVLADYFSKDLALSASHGKKYKILTAIAMFYDLEDPVKFVKDARAVIDDDGVFIVQMNYLKLMLEGLTYDNISHEHLCYYSLTTLDKLFRQCGFTIAHAEVNGVNGGSLRVFAYPQINGQMRLPTYSVRELLQEEREFFQDGKVYAIFRTRVENMVNNLRAFLQQLKAQGKKVYAYGASTRGATLLQKVLEGCEEPLLLGVAERDPNKYGRRMAGLDLEILPEDQVREKADYFLLLPYHFWETICKREKEWMAKGGKFILPLPYPKVVSMTELAGKMVPVSLSLQAELAVC